MLLLGLALGGCAARSPLVGRWVGQDDKGRQVVLDFAPGGTFRARTGKDTLHGTYSADFSVTPAHLDLVAAGSKPVRTIIKVHNGRLTVQPSAIGQKRPSRFTHRAIVYRRNG